MRDYKNIKAYKLADKVVLEIYKATKTFPNEERYGLTSQLRRAAVSIPTNIAEGASRQHKRDYLNFLFIARGSLAETEYLLEFCHRLKYLMNGSYKKLEDLRKETGALLWRFYKSF